MNNSEAPSKSLNQENNNDDINLVALLWVLARGWKIIITLSILGLLLGFIYSRYVQPTYKTDALIQIDEQSNGLSALGANISELVGSEASPAETERELIKSRMVLMPVVEKLHLDIKLDNPELDTLDRIASSSLPTQTSTADGVYLETSNGLAHISQFEVPQAYLNQAFTLISNEGGFTLSHSETPEILTFKGKLNTPHTFLVGNEEIRITVNSLPVNDQPISLHKLSIPSVINTLNSELLVSERGKQTGIVQLSLTGPNQTQITRVLESIVQSYIDQNQARSSEQTTQTIEFMETQIPELKNKLEQSEEAFNKFREKYGTIDVSQEAEILLNESAQIEAQFSELNLKKAELLTYYTEEHPLLIQIYDQLDALNARRKEIDDITKKLPEIQREFIKLSEDMGINREIYLTMLKNYEQLKIARAGEIGYVRVVDMPISTFNAIAPKKLQIWGLSLLLGTMLGSLIVLLKSLLRNTIKDPDRLEAKTGVPVIATIPRSNKVHRLQKSKKPGDHLLGVVDHNSLSYEGIKSLRTSLMFGTSASNKLSNANHKGKVILVTGESPDIGKSFVCANLAETFSQLNKKVLIIDGDMRMGELHHTFPIANEIGLADYLSNKTNRLGSSIADATSDASQQDQSDNASDQLNVAQFIEPTSFDFIDLLPRGRKPHNPSSLLASDRYQQLISHLVQIYDYIIIDTPPVLAATDAVIMAQYADQVLLVTRYNQSIEGQVSYAVNQLYKGGVTVDGIVLNDMTQSIMDKYSYHYSYAYGNRSDK